MVGILRRLKLTIAVTFLFFIAITPALAASLELRPASGTTAAGQAFTVEVYLNVAAGENIWGYETTINVPSNLTYNSSQFVVGSLFPSSGARNFHAYDSGLISMGAYFDSTFSGVTASGTVGTLSFSANSGTSATLAMNCNQFTNVYTSGATQTNVFTNCASLNPRSIWTISGGGANPTATPTNVPGAPTATPTPTTSGSSPSSTPTPTSTPTLAPGAPTYTPAPTSSSSLPSTGVVENSLWFLIAGIVLIMFGTISYFIRSNSRCL